MKFKFICLIFVIAAIFTRAWSTEIEPQKNITMLSTNQLVGIFHEWCAPKDLVRLKSALPGRNTELNNIVDRAIKIVTTVEVQNSGITHEGIIQLSAFFPNITNISFVNCENLRALTADPQNPALFYIIPGLLPRLQKFHLADAPSILQPSGEQLTQPFEFNWQRNP